MLDFIFRVDPGGGDGLFRSVPSNVGSCRGYIHHIPCSFAVGITQQYGIYVLLG